MYCRTMVAAKVVSEYPMISRRPIIISSLDVAGNNSRVLGASTNPSVFLDPIMATGIRVLHEFHEHGDEVGAIRSGLNAR